MPKREMTLDWMSGGAGRSDRVPAPWTPVRATGDALSCWGRAHAFRGGPLPAQITSAGEALLARPIALSARLDGAWRTWRACNAAPPERHPHGRWARRAAGGRLGRLALRSAATVHYDGTVRVDLAVEPLEPVPLEALRIEIPVRRRHAGFLYAPFTPAVRTAELPAGGAAGPWSPLIWLGSDERGLGWGCESDAGWDEGPDALALVPGRGEVALRLEVVRRPRRLETPLRIGFALQANPWRPAPKDPAEFRNIHVHWYDELSEATLRDWRARGARTIIFHSAWADLHAYPETAHARALRALVGRCRRARLKLLLYFGVELSSGAPEWPVWSEAWRMLGETRQEHGYVPYRPPCDPAFHVCSASGWQDFIVAGIEHVMKHYGVDGVYLDGLPAWPSGCRNRLHGCGTERPDGTTALTSRLWQGRALMERIYTAVRAVKPDGRISLHANPGPLCFTGPFGTDCFGGEQYGGDFRKAALDPVRAFHVGLPGWGLPSELIAYTQYDAAVATGLLHGLLPRPMGKRSYFQSLVFGVWAVQDAFGVGRADWHPYYRAAGLVRGLPEGILASAWNRPGHGLLLVVANRGNDDRPVTLSVAAQRLGHGEALEALDLLPGGVEWEQRGRRFSAVIPGAGFRLVFLAPGGSALWPRMRRAASRIALEPDLRAQVDEWQMCGPFAPAYPDDPSAAKRDVPAGYRGMETVFPPDAPDGGAGGPPWRTVKAREHVVGIRSDVATDGWCVVYARTRLLFPHLVPLTERNPVDIHVIPFHAMRVSVNGRELFAHGGAGAPRYGQGRHEPVRLRTELHPGWNEVRIKMVNRRSGSLFFKVTEPDADAPHHLVTLRATDPA